MPFLGGNVCPDPFFSIFMNQIEFPDDITLKRYAIQHFGVTILHILGMRNKFSKAVAYTTDCMISREPSKKRMHQFIFFLRIL